VSTEPQPAAPPPAPGGDGPSEDEKNLAMIAHAGGILPFLFFVPLLIWKTKGESSAYINEHAKEALNFQLTLTIGDVVALLVIIIAGGWGLVLWLPVIGAHIGMGMMGTMAAGKGKPFRYVVNARFIQ
jgi:hypothetical protein